MNELKKFSIQNFEPVKVKEVLYGNSIIFNHLKRYIKFTSIYHEPDYIHYDQIEKLIIFYDKKKMLLWLGIATLFLFFGIFILLIRIKLPPWKISIYLKKEKKPIVIRARMEDHEASNLANFCTNQFKTTFIPK
ncbi:MAG: hypothetical protein ACTSWX_04660 [Promethearchaeota archaeon]